MHQVDGDRVRESLHEAARAVPDHLTLPSQHTVLGLGARLGEVRRELG